MLTLLPDHADPEVVTGEEWLPERLIGSQLDGDLLFLEFDNAPDEASGDDEERGFMEHEIELIQHRFEQILTQQSDIKSKTEAMVSLFVMAHEKSSSDIIEMLESEQAWDSECWK